jgi:hypothetical protein
MAMRTTKGTVTLVRTVRVGVFAEQLPAGNCPTETDEELMEGMSFPAYQRPATIGQLVLDPPRPSVTDIAVVDLQQLEEAPTMDGMQPSMPNVDPARIEP